jgi:hypothetical protein
MQRRKLKGNRGVYKCHTFGTLHVVLRPDDEVHSWPSCQLFQGAMPWGQTPEEAQAELLDVFDMI